MSQSAVIQLQQQAINHLNNKQVAAAITSCQQILQLQPQFAPACKLMAMAFQIKEENKTAKYWYKKALEYQPQFPEVYANLGSLYAKEQDWENAISAYQSAIQLQPKMAGVYRNLARIYTQINQIEQATECWYQAFQLEPNWGTPEEHLTLGNRLFKQQQLEAAKRCYQQAIQQKLDYADAYHNLGEISSREYHFKQAIDYYQRAIELNPSSAITYQRLGDIWSQNKQYQDAIKAYQKASEVNPTSFETYQKLAQLLQQEQCHPQAVNAYFKAIELKPYFQWSYLNLWQYLAQQNQLEKALEHYKYAVKSMPNVPLIELNLAEILTRLGNLKAANHHYQKASYKKLKQSNPEIAQQYWCPEQVLSPQFIIIGTQKGGTTSLYRYLGQHSHIFPAIRKEIYFWNHHHHRGLDWYLAHFPRLSSTENWMSGEASPNYLEDQQAPDRLFKVFPNIKLIVLLRNPVDRAVSQYHHWIRLNREKLSLEAAFKLELKYLSFDSGNLNIDPRYWSQTSRYLWRGLYVEFLQRWMTIFPRQQFLILKSEDFYQQPEVILNQVCDFLNLPPASEINLTPYNQGFYQPMSSEIRQQLHAFFEPYNHKLEAFLDMNFYWNFD
ncbi:MAG: tetratricopeptide repeat protein [Microcoleaceae cyanobacterium]